MALNIPTTTSKGNYSDPPPYEGNSKTAHSSSPPLGNHPSDKLRQQGASVLSQEHTAVSPKPLDLSTIGTPQDKQSSEQSLMQKHGKLNENERQSVDSCRHSARSHNSSTSFHDAGNQLMSGNTKPSNPIIDRFNSKISSPSNEQRYSEPLIQSPSTPQTTFAHYSSSALGFGGPSDWEHFGDYDAEEVDDTALYSRSEPRIPADTIVSAAELPVETSPTDEPGPPTQQSLGESTPTSQNIKPRSPSQSLDIASPLKSAKVLESAITKQIIPLQQPSIRGSPSKDGISMPDQPSSPSRSQTITKPNSAKSLESPIDHYVDVSSIPSDTTPPISNDNSLWDRGNHSEKPSQVIETIDADKTTQNLPYNSVQGQAYLNSVSALTESAEPAESDDTSTTFLRKGENDTSQSKVGTASQVEIAPTPKNFPLQREISRDATEPMSNNSPPPTVFSTVSKDELQPTINVLKSDGDIPLLTAKEIVMPTTSPGPGHSYTKPTFQDRRKQFRKNSLQFQEKLKRFQPTSGQSRESSSFSQKRPNQSQEISSPNQGKLEKPEDRPEELKLERHQGKQSQLRSEQYEQQMEHPKPEQNKEEEPLGEFEQPQPAQPFKQLAQPTEDLSKQSRSSEQLDQPKPEHLVLPRSNKSKGLPRYPSLETPKLVQSESELSQPKQPNLETHTPEQPKLEEPKLEQLKLEHPELEQQTMLQQIMLEYPWAKQPQNEPKKQDIMSSVQSYEKPKISPKNVQQPQEAPIDKSQETSEKLRMDLQPSRESPEHRNGKGEQHQEALTENPRGQFIKHKSYQEQFQDNTKQLHERTWLDLSGLNDAEQASSPVELLPGKSNDTAMFETTAEALTQSKVVEELNEQPITQESIISQKSSLESLRNTIKPHVERDSTSHLNDIDIVNRKADGEVTPLSRKLSQDDSQKSSLHETASSVPKNDDGVGALYSDLDLWGRASLKRYISMLYEEAKANTDKEKLDIFSVFINRESKLRAVLYGADDGPAPVQPNLVKNNPQHLSQTLAKPSQKALPALPLSEAPQRPLAGDGSIENPANIQASQIIINSDSVGLQDKSNQDQPPHLKKTPKADSPTDETQYSPGGRPIVPREPDFEDKPKNSTTKLKSPREKVNKVLTQFTHYMYPSTSSSLDAPAVVNSSNKLEPPKPGYKPFKISERESEPINYLSKRQSAYRPYAALTMGSLDSGLIATQEPIFKPSNAIETPTTATQDEPRQVNQDVEKKERLPQIATTAARNKVDVSPSPDLRRFVKSDFDSLVSVLPSSATIPQELIELRDMKNAMDAVPDDFSFIHQSVVAWDAIAKKEREAHERARHARQGESERKVDELFNEHEIGYADISELEEEFKRSEAAKKADEDRLEYQTFLSGVFDLVWTRLHREIDELTPLYDKYTRITNDTLVGKEMFDESATSFALAPTMGYLLALHQKLEVRHQKAFEAVLERDRRLKKTEVSPWYAIGNVTKVKQLEKKFESAEKNAIVEYCAQRDTRANKLMDVLDQNTLRGVGANQDYMECLMNGVRRVASGRAFASMPSSESSLGLNEVMKAKSITTILASSSEQIVQTFHVADMLLNAADYEVSIAKAKLANADAETFKRLKDERSKEDQKLMRDLEHRLALIREDSRRTHDEIVKLTLFLGIQNGHAETQQKIPGLPDPAHEERIQRALQEAKRRNESEENRDRNAS